MRKRAASEYEAVELRGEASRPSLEVPDFDPLANRLDNRFRAIENWFARRVMRPLACKVLTVLIAMILVGVGHTDSSAQSDQETLSYRFAKGDKARYRLKIRQHYKSRGQGAAENQFKRTFVYRQKVQRLRKGGKASLDVDVLEYRVTFGKGENALELDSRNRHDLALIESSDDPVLRHFAAILTSKVKMTVQPDGQVPLFRLSKLAARFNNTETRNEVNKLIEQIKWHAFLSVPGTPIKDTKSWRTNVPISFASNFLFAGEVWPVEATLKLDRIEGTGANRMAHYKVQSFDKRNLLSMAEGSLAGGQVDSRITKLDGTLSFAVAKGYIQSYQFRIQTHTVVKINGSLFFEHKMDEEISLARLAEPVDEKRLAKEEEERRLAEEAKAKLKAEEEAEAKRLAKEEEERRLAEEAKAKLKAEEEAEAKRLAKEEEEKRLAEEAKPSSRRRKKLRPNGWPRRRKKSA